MSELIDIFSLKQNGSDLKTFVQDIKNAIVDSTEVSENDHQSVAVKVFLKGVDDKN